MKLLDKITIQQSSFTASKHEVVFPYYSRILKKQKKKFILCLFKNYTRMFETVLHFI